MRNDGATTVNPSWVRACPEPNGEGAPAPHKLTRVRGRGCPGSPKARREAGTSSSLRVKFLKHVLAADLDFAFVLAGLGEIVGKLHP